jgi:uncharacterized Zn-finger protein
MRKTGAVQSEKRVDSLDTGSAHCINGKYRCRYCNKQFYYASTLKHHVHSHTEVRPQKCTKCEMTFTTAQELGKHTSSVHHASEFVCKCCRKKFSSLGFLKRHLMIHANGRLNTEFDAQFAFSRNHSKNRTAGQQKLSCSDDAVEQSSSFNLFLGSVADGGRLFGECMAFDTVSKASRRQRRCGFCGKQFLYPKDLKCHLSTHTGEKPYKCEHCGKEFGRSDKLGSHIKTHNANKTSRQVRSQEDGSRLDQEQRELINRYERLFKVRATAARKFTPDLFETKSCSVKSTSALVDCGKLPVTHAVSSLPSYNNSVRPGLLNAPCSSMTVYSSCLFDVDSRSMSTVGPGTQLPDAKTASGDVICNKNITNCSGSNSVYVPDSQKCDAVNAFSVGQTTYNSSVDYSSCSSNVRRSIVNGCMADKQFFTSADCICPWGTVQPVTDVIISSSAVCSSVNVCSLSNVVSETVGACGLKQPNVAVMLSNGSDRTVLQPVVTSHSAITTSTQSNNAVLSVSLDDLGSGPNSLGTDSKTLFRYEDRKCAYCGKQFQYMKDLKRHLPMHTGIKLYKCEVCGKCFGRADKLGAHIKLHYKPKARTSKRKSRFDGEIVKEDSGSEKETTTSDLYDANGRVNTDTFAAVGKKTAAITEGKQHMCSYCGKQFTRENNLTAHIRTHTGERPYVCFYCSKAFTRSERLKLHLRTHTGEKPYECQLCFRLFSRLHNLNRHSLTHMTKQQRESMQRKGGKCD